MLRTLWRFYSEHWNNHRLYLAGAIACTVLTNVISALIPKTIQILLDHPHHAFINGIMQLCFLGILTFFVRSLSRYWFFIPGRTLEYEKRNAYFKHILSLAPQLFRRFSLGDLLARSTQDVQALRMLAGFGFLSMINFVSAFVINLAFMFWLFPWLTCGFFFVLVFGFMFTVMGTFRMARLNRAFFDQTGKLTDLMGQLIHCVPLLRNYEAVDDGVRALDEEQKHATHLQLSMVKLRSWYLPAVGLSGALGTAVILFYIAQTQNNALATIGSIAAYLGYCTLLVNPLNQLSWMISLMQNALTGIDRMNEVMTLPSSIHCDAQTNKGQPPRTLNLVRTQITAHSKTVLSDLKLQWKPGHVFGFFGPSGSGKSLLFRVVSGLEYDQKHLITEEESPLDRLALMERTALVSQHPFLFSETLRFNIDLGRNATDAHLLRACEHACFRFDAERFPDGLETKVGQKGVLLSGGQKQRIALARALIQPQQLLLLDDVMSAVDHETEVKLIQNLYEHYHKTGFWIASHRISALQHADQIFCLEQGVIVAQGSHQELVKKYAPYKKIWKHQTMDDGT